MPARSRRPVTGLCWVVVLLATSTPAPDTCLASSTTNDGAAPSGEGAYGNLFSMSSTIRGLNVSRMSPIGNPNGNTFLAGTVWQTYQGTRPPLLYDWFGDIYPTGDPTSFEVTSGTVPPPRVPAFINAHWAGAASPAWIGLGGQNTCVLDATAGGDPDRIRFFKTPVVHGDWSLDIRSGQPVDINVSGIAIWMLDSGLRSQRTVRVNGTSSDMLVICVKKTEDSARLLPYGFNDVGMVFVGGLTSPIVPVILVTDGYVAVDNHPLPSVSFLQCIVDWMSVYADFAWIRAPDLASTGTFSWKHVRGAHPQAEANLQRLLDRGLLPNACGRLVVDFRPKTLNRASRGRWVTASVEPTPPLTARDIEIASIRLNGTVPVDSAAPVTMGDHDANGATDLTVRFSRAAVERVLPDGDRVPVRLAGMVAGCFFSGTDSIRVRRGQASVVAGSHSTADSAAEAGRREPSGFAAESTATQSPVRHTGPAQLALRRIAPNPIEGELRVTFSLEDSKAATLALFDVSGRRVIERRVHELGPGWHTLVLVDARRLRAGVYVVRLTQGGRSLMARAAVVR